MVRYSALLLFLVAACGFDREQLFVERDGIRLPDAYVTSDVPTGFELQIDKDGNVTEKGDPSQQTWLLTIDRRTSWSTVRKLGDRFAGKTLWAVVGYQRKQRVIPIHLGESSDSLQLYIRAKGQVCVSPPGVEEAGCADASYTNQAERASVARIVEASAAKYESRAYRILVSDSMAWGDAVLTIDTVNHSLGKKARPTLSVSSSAF